MGFFKKDYKKVEPGFAGVMDNENGVDKFTGPVQTQQQVRPVDMMMTPSMQQQIPMQQYQPMPQYPQQYQPQLNFQPGQVISPQMDFPAMIPQQMQQVADPNVGSWNNDKAVVKSQLMKVKDKIAMMESDLAYIKESIKLLNRFLE